MVHWSFEDRAAAKRSEAARLSVFRRVRDEIRESLREFAKQADSITES